MITASTVEEGRDAARRERPDLVILDIMLPGDDGWHYLEGARSDETLCGIPVIILSMIAEDNIQKGFAMGAAKVLQKPIGKSELLSAISKLSAGGRALSKILVVDDDYKAVELVAKHLEADGHSILRAHGGAEAIDIARTELPDLILLDLMMPDLTGFDVIKELRSSADTAEIDVLIVSAKSLTPAERKELEGSVAKIVHKSEFNGVEFMAEVSHMLGASLDSGQGAKPGAETEGSFIKEGVREEAAAGEGAVEEQERPGPLLMVVEGDPVSSTPLAPVFEGAGFKCSVYTMGSVAIGRMAASSPDLVIIASKMADMDFLEFMIKKSTLKGAVDLPMLIVPFGEGGKAGRAVAIDALLRKPLKRYDLLHLINAMVPLGPDMERVSGLIIDNDPNVVKMISSYFNEDRYDISTALDGGECMREALRIRPDFIIIDMAMPGLNGVELAGRLRKEEPLHGTALVLLSPRSLEAGDRLSLMESLLGGASGEDYSEQDLVDEVKAALVKREGRVAGTVRK